MSRLNIMDKDTGVSKIIDKIHEEYPWLYLNYIDESDITFRPESEDDNIEYKKTLCNCDEEKVVKYSLQMERRMSRSNKRTAKYVIGVMDDGEIIGLDEDELEGSIHMFVKITKSVYASVIIMDIMGVKNGHIIMAGVRKKKMKNEDNTFFSDSWN